MGQAILDLGSRKIQLVRGSAFINLPRVWIRTNHLCKGDKVKIALRNDGTLEMSCFVASEEGGDA